MKITRETKIIEFIEYDSIRFYRDKKGYWLSAKVGRKDHPKRLHIYVWEKHNGTIPNGYHIHHIDHDTDNNEIENLELMEKFEHLSYHAKLQDKNVMLKNLSEKARPKAIEWHKSEEGKKWHVKHYQSTKDKLLKRYDITCLNCGKEVNVGGSSHKNKFCSDKCKCQYSDKLGIYDEERKCIICGNKFMTYKHGNAESCSKSCAAKLMYSRRCKDA